MAGHADQPAKIENVTLKGNISVSYGDAPSYSEDAPGIGVFYGVITSDADTLTKAVIDENCVVNLYLNDIVPHSSLNFVDNNYLLGYAYNDATTAINPGCNIKGHIYANIVDGLRMVAHEDLRYYFEASTIEGYNKFVSSYANEHVGTIFRKQVGSIITYEERFHLNIAQDIDFHDQVVAPIDSNRVEIDGHGHTLSNIKFGYDGNDKSGLVGNPGSPISNLTLRNVRSEGSQAGAFAGLSSGLALTNCRLEGKVEIIYNDLPDTPRKEDYPGIGAFVGIMSEGTLSFDNVVLASDANVTLDFNGLKANEASKSISFLAGYHAGGTVTGEPTQEEGSNVEVKGLANLSSSGSIPSYPDNGMDFNDGTITIDGTTDATDDHRMLVEVKHTAFNHFDGLEGITSGKIVIKNVHFFREIDGRDDGYALTLGFDANVEVVFENCTFENMYCAIYCNRNETGKVNISFTNCTFTNTDYLYCYDNSGVEGTINVQYDSETAKTINENKLHD